MDTAEAASGGETAFTLLLECDSSKRQLNLTATLATELPDLLEKEVKKIVGENAKLVLDASERTPCDSPCYLLQRYSPTWNDFVDVGPPTSVASGDKLRAIFLKPKLPKDSSAESEVSLSHIICS